MFEQSLYEPELVAKPLKEGDPLYNYEIKGWQLSPRIYKILGTSALLNILVLVVAVQGSLLTMKGCDSPLVNTMCQALDTIYVGSMVFGTDREYVDVAYDKTDLGDVDITYVDVTGLENQKLYYPANYFQIANPEKYTIDPATGELIAAMPSPDMSGFNEHLVPFTPSPSAGGDSLFNTKPIYPKSVPNPVVGDLPQPGGSSVGSNPIRRNNKRGGGRITPETTPEGNVPGMPDPNTTAEVKPSPSPTVEATAPLEASDINTRPFKEIAADVNAMIDNKQIDLQAPVQILATAKLGKDGKIVKGSFRVSNAVSSDQKLAALVPRAVAAFNDSNLLNTLKDLSGKDLSFLVQQDQTNIVAAVKAQVESETRAQSLATVVQFGISLAKQKKEKAIAEIEALNDPSKAEALQNLKDDLELLKNTNVGVNGKEFIVKFESPKEPVHQMIQRKLAEQKAEPKQPNSSGVTANPTQNTAKN